MAQAWQTFFPGKSNRRFATGNIPASPSARAVSPPPHDHHTQQQLMVIKFVFRPHSLPITFFPRPCFFHKRPSPSLLSGKAAGVLAVSSTSNNHSLPYGPSIGKGQNPVSISANSPESTDDGVLVDEESFTRVFDIAALRLPSEHCFALETRLRGHLLNWPRIRNIARVPGDEIDEEFKGLFDSKGSSSTNFESNEDELVELNRRIHGKAEGDGERLSPVLYRDKLARTFNSKGFVKFRNLAKLSRPKRTKKTVEEKDGKKRGGIGRNEIAVVEVVEGEDGGVGSSEEGDLRGLLGDEFKEKWRGSTRLLLLDEQYANKENHDLPEAIKVSVSLHL